MITFKINPNNESKYYSIHYESDRVQCTVHYSLFKKSIMSTSLDLILFLLNEVSFPALEKSHSAGTEVAGMARYVVA